MTGFVLVSLDWRAKPHKTARYQAISLSQMVIKTSWKGVEDMQEHLRISDNRRTAVRLISSTAPVFRGWR